MSSFTIIYEIFHIPDCALKTSLKNVEYDADSSLKETHILADGIQVKS